MSQRASPTLIGAFVMGALVLLVAALLIVGTGRFAGNWETLVLYFRSSTTGLAVGSPVVLKGVQIGVVKEIQVAYDDESGEFVVPVYIEIDQDKVVWPGELRKRLDTEETYLSALREGLRARLGMQSLLTGLLQVEIGFFPGAAFVLTGNDTRYRELPTIPSELERFREAVLDIPVASIVTGFVETLDGLNRLVSAPELGNVLKNLDTAVSELALTATDLHQIIPPAGASLDAALGDLGEATRTITPKLEAFLVSLMEVSDRLGRLAERADSQIGPLAASVRHAGESAQAAFVSAQRALDGVSSVVDQRSPLHGEALNAMRSLTAAAKALRDMADYLERHPEALLHGKR